MNNIIILYSEWNEKCLGFIMTTIAMYLSLYPAQPWSLTSSRSFADLLIFKMKHWSNIGVTIVMYEY